MKAAVVTRLGSPLSVREGSVPEVVPGRILVKLDETGVCHTDLHAARGDWPVKPGLNAKTVRGSIVGTRRDLQECLEFAGEGSRGEFHGGRSRKHQRRVFEDGTQRDRTPRRDPSLTPGVDPDQGGRRPAPYAGQAVDQRTAARRQPFGTKAHT